MSRKLCGLCLCYLTWKPLKHGEAKQRGTEHIDQVELERYLRIKVLSQGHVSIHLDPRFYWEPAHIFDMSPHVLTSPGKEYRHPGSG